MGAHVEHNNVTDCQDALHGLHWGDKFYHAISFEKTTRDFVVVVVVQVLQISALSVWNKHEGPVDAFLLWSFKVKFFKIRFVPTENFTDAWNGSQSLFESILSF